MSIDFTPVNNGDMKLGDFAKTLDVDDMRAATHESIDYLISLIEHLDDAAIVFDPVDPNANDPYAAEGEEEIGWSIGHLIAHVTASSEEGAAFSSILGRGIPIGGRLRYETPWREITTKAQCLQRLEESRKIRLACFDALPDEPHLDVYRDMSERAQKRLGHLNLVGAYLYGLTHEIGHYEQIKAVIQQIEGA